jgi:FYVE/RhoGEF/PH domain-containing protein 5/6
MAQNERRRSQWKLKPINEALEAKRRKIIEEFVETERSYVDGLNLIHSVCWP